MERKDFTVDLTEALNEWPYEPGQINVRVIEGNDGDPKIQMRLDLGILQMEVTGRPDGQRPNNCDSYLEYFETLVDDMAAGGAGPSVVDGEDAEHGDGPSAGDDGHAGDGPKPPRRRRGSARPGAEPGGVEDAEGTDAPESAGTTPPAPDAQHPADPGTAGGAQAGDAGESDGDNSPPTMGNDPSETEFALSPDDCRLLREEAVQFYHRYISLLVLGDYQGVLRDTTRNLRVLDLCQQYAEAEDDREVLEQFRPYLTMMRTRAVASQAIGDGEPKAALWAIEEGMNALRKMYADAGREDDFEGASEVLLLRGMRDELMKKLPASQRSELAKRLQEALEKENYELAAILRDELKMLRE